MTNFAVLPPEVNSVRMFAGAGPAPMVAAAATWDGLATELVSAATFFDSVISQLASGSWQGPASAAMASAAAPYAGWLTTAAARAGRAAAQAKAAVTAFEAARAATVHPAIVAANRTQLMSLVVSNLLGQNTPAIAAAEAQYEQMWAQDVAALVGYHGGASAVAAQLASWHQWLLQLPSLLPSPDSPLGDPGINLRNGNSGSNKVGGGNTGKSNKGFGNTGDKDSGLGLTGGNQRAFTTLSSGTGNFGFGNSWFINTGVGSSDLLSTRFGNPGTANTGLTNSSFQDAGAFNAGGTNAASFNAGGFNWGMFYAGQIDTGFANSGNTNTGGFDSGELNAGFRSLGLGPARTQDFGNTSSNSSGIKKRQTR